MQSLTTVAMQIFLHSNHFFFTIFDKLIFRQFKNIINLFVDSFFKLTLVYVKHPIRNCIYNQLLGNTFNQSCFLKELLIFTSYNNNMHAPFQYYYELQFLDMTAIRQKIKENVSHPRAGWFVVCGSTFFLV